MSTKRKFTWQEDLLYGGTMFIVCSIGIAFWLFVYELIERI